MRVFRIWPEVGGRYKVQARRWWGWKTLARHYSLMGAIEMFNFLLDQEDWQRRILR